MRLQIDKLGKVAITVEEGYWDINKDYDKLTVVEVKDKFATYISRKPVPAGTMVTDRVYWIPFSSLKENIVIDYNKLKVDVEEQINLLRVDVESFKFIQQQVIELIKVNKESTEQGVILRERIKVITDKIDDYLAGLDFPAFGDSLELVNGRMEVRSISEEELLNILN